MPPARAPGPLAYLVLLFASVAWGATFSLQKIIMAKPGAHPVGVTFGQAVLGLCVGVALARLARQRLRPRREVLVFCFVLGMLGTAIPNGAFFLAAPHLPAGILALSVATVPLLTYVFALLFRIEAFARLRALGLAFGFVSMVLVLAPESSLPEPGQALWLVPALLAVVCYAAEAIYAVFQRPVGADSLPLVAGGMAMAALVLAPVTLATDSFYPLQWPPDRHDYAFVAMATLSLLAYVTYLWLIQRAGAVFASQVGYLVTLSGVGWGMVVFGERHSLWIWAALALLVAGVMLVRPRA